MAERTLRRGPHDVGLRIAVVSTSATSTPPPGYGGTERFVADLARALADLGHHPTVFATGDSTCVGARGCGLDRPVWPPDALAELRFESAAWREIARGDFDVVHVNDPVALAFRSWVMTPTVATVHHPWTAALSAHYVAYPEVAFAAISHRQAALSPEVRFSAVIHHGLRPEDFPEGGGDGGYCAFLGRFAPEKAPHLAIDAAAAAGLPIRLGGAPHAPDGSYFTNEVLPRLRGQATWLGDLDYVRKVHLLQGAVALLFPIEWEEPFGLVMIEAMLVGTPVIAFPRGAVPEVIDEGVTGLLARSPEELTARLRDVRALDRRRCREHAQRRWSATRMARQYVDLYRETAGRSPARARSLRARWSR